jgi:hypothetical protein
MLRIETVFAGLGMDMTRSSRPRSNALRSEAAASFRQADLNEAARAADAARACCPPDCPNQAIVGS